MNVASLELCKELYELSGWKTEMYWVPDVLNTNPDTTEPSHTVIEWSKLTSRFNPDRVMQISLSAPAYDLGYLLRRLSDQEDLANLSLHRCEHQDGSRNWGIEVTNLHDVFGDKKFSYADTPEDAAAKLAIELFKQGILTKEQA